MLLAVLTAALTSCATKDPAPLIADPNASRETALPWNEQQKWEREGEAAALNQQRR
jgi:predicted ATPase